MFHRNRAVTVSIALALAVAACAGSEGTEEPEDTLPSGTSPRPSVVQATAPALVAFDTCDAFLDHVISHAVDLVGPYGLGDMQVFFSEGEARAAEDSAGSGDAGAEFSGTNVQVEGVDEPDLVKTDGQRIVLLSEGDLIVVDVTGEEPVETGRLTVAPDFGVQSLFLAGDKALLFGSSWGHGPMPLAERDAIAPWGGTPSVQILEVDISGDPELVRTMTIDGALVSGRMVGDSVRLVLTSGPVGFEWAQPKGSGLRAERDATEANREIVRNSTEENWIPYYYVSDPDGRVVGEGTLFDCDRVSHPEEFSGVDMLSVVTIDVAGGLDVVDSTGVLARGDTVYASEDNLYVATQNWDSWRWMETGDESDRPDGPVTEIHKFDIGDPVRTEYMASGSVEGYLLNQFAMDEHDGHLRVASTTTPNWWGSGPDSESRITVLRETGEGLAEVGVLDGLGVTEQIYSVRFMGDVAYVVTFRQTDPLYTIDLSNARNPTLLGELKIPGYSAYLHPVSEGLLLGIGQDATDEGMVQGSQVSLFDVTDLANPVRLDTYTLSEGSSSQVEYDHHAFLYWEGTAVIPVQQWNWDGKTEDVWTGAVGVAVRDNDLVEVAKLTHPGGEGKDWDWRAQIVRSMAIDDSIYTISSKGILKSSQDGLDEQAWLEF